MFTRQVKVIDVNCEMSDCFLTKDFLKQSPSNRRIIGPFPGLLRSSSGPPSGPLSCSNSSPYDVMHKNNGTSKCLCACSMDACMESGRACPLSASMSTTQVIRFINRRWSSHKKSVQIR